MQIIGKKIRPQITLIRHISEPGSNNHSLHVVVVANHSNAIALPFASESVTPLEGNLSGIGVRLVIRRSDNIKEMLIPTPLTFAFRLDQLPLEENGFVEVVVEEEDPDGNTREVGKGVVRHEEADIDDDAG